MNSTPRNTVLHASEPIAREHTVPVMELFAYLQLLDLLTTLAGLRLGAQEVSPFIRMTMQFDAGVGLMIWNLWIILRLPGIG
ncbi:MAG: hypothetical protein AAB225_06390 [Acidobacteriota bacterium]